MTRTAPYHYDALIQHIPGSDSIPQDVNLMIGPSCIGHAFPGGGGLVGLNLEPPPKKDFAFSNYQPLFISLDCRFAWIAIY